MSTFNKSLKQIQTHQQQQTGTIKTKKTTKRSTTADDNEVTKIRDEALALYSKSRATSTLNEVEVERLLYRFIKSMNEYPDIQKSKYIIVAASGGADSMALLFLLKGWCNNHGIGIVAVTVDHGLTPPSEDIPAISECIKALGSDIQHIVMKVDWVGSGPPATGLLAALRRRRFDILKQIAERFEANAIFVGSNRNDQIETFIHRLQHGSGIEGLAAMSRRVDSPGGNISVYRPLLDMSKDELFGVCNVYNVRFTHDATNDMTSFERNRIRLALSRMDIPPKDFNSVLSIFREYRNMFQQQVEEFIMNEVMQTFHRCLPMFSIPLIRLVELPEPIAVRVLYHVSMALRGEHMFFRHSEYVRMYRALKHTNSKTLDRTFFYIEDEYLVVHGQSIFPTHTITVPIKQANLDGKPIQFGPYSISISIPSTDSTVWSDNNNVSNNNNNDMMDVSAANKTVIRNHNLHSVRYYDPATDESFGGHIRKRLGVISRLAKTLVPVIVNEDNKILCIPHTKTWMIPSRYNVFITQRGPAFQLSLDQDDMDNGTILT
ncbi:hypothetical protein SAMD00019534_010680 [Acytostelium subglobosum LB1]|uniref:hypothetical protein n=1 Tax=Acytostelium subglobosum LB1 TaxID=1410327 RepID=UPI0006449174|nr:hypothetical protein SAMD00019534_010680 [Acytostelium subglobosum LB1]GAM17893.1 hypothetical protein SAMD00019534_010680 [Acytostelium subglobosum LB1]|eukprot:XP_012758489.1 hypothetical protein SAMD00019534_010680 [Acytostelium subglobosum LB1]